MEKKLQAAYDGKNRKPLKRKEEQDIIVTKFEKVVEYQDGAKIEKRVPKMVNLTKKIRETAKLVKTEAVSAENKLAEIDRICRK